jgi:hypothetical protein
MITTRSGLLAFGSVDASDSLSDGGRLPHPSLHGTQTVPPKTLRGPDMAVVTLRGLLNWGRVLGLVVTAGVSGSFWFFVVLWLWQ